MAPAHAPLLRNSRLKLIEEVLVRVLDLVDVGLLFLEQACHFLILLAEFRKEVLCLFDNTREIGRILWTIFRYEVNEAL